MRSVKRFRHAAAASAAVLLCLCLLTGCLSGASQLAGDILDRLNQDSSSSAGLPEDGEDPDDTGSTPAVSQAQEPSGGEYAQGGWISDTVYQNSSLDLQLTLPQGWAAASDEEIRTMMEAGQSALTEEQQQAAEENLYKTTYDFVVTDLSTGANLQMMAENLSLTTGGALVDEDAYLNILRTQLEQVAGMGYTFPSDLQTRTIAGLDFRVLECLSESNGAAQYYYCHKMGDHMVTLILTVAIGDQTMISAVEGCLTRCGETASQPDGSGTELSFGSSEESIDADGRPSGSIYEGQIGDVMSTSFFDFTVNAATLIPSDAGEAYDYLVVNTTVRSTFPDTIPMFDTDFELYWDTQDDDDPWMPMLPGLLDSQLPEEYSLDFGESRTGDLVFQVDKGVSEFALAYVEIYEDGFEGDMFVIYFTAN